MRILGIETSCDETSVAVVEDGMHVRSCVIASSKDVFEKSGGVVPEEAARKQVECMLPVLEQALTNAACDMKDIDAIAVTNGPGLIGSLLVGTATAKTLSMLRHVPLIPVHHTFGHLSSTWLAPDDENDWHAPSFPCITLSVSGGHSDLWLREDHLQATLLGTTRDDAAGEAFDKGALLLGLPYPGGPSLSALAEKGDEMAYDFPVPLKNEGKDFSFSGLKTSLKYLLRDLPQKEAEEKKADIAASYQYAICMHLIERMKRAIAQHPDIHEVHLVGGVAANKRLRQMLTDTLTGNATLRIPSKMLYCTDNAAMIAAAGYFLLHAQPQITKKPLRTSATISEVFPSVL